jgi:hypothetical protein
MPCVQCFSKVDLQLSSYRSSEVVTLPAAQCTTLAELPADPKGRLAGAVVRSPRLAAQCTTLA